MTISPFYIDEADGTPRSSFFDDIYYMPEKGREESRYVYIEGTDIPRRLEHYPKDHIFHVFEAGFGTGLNFCETLSAFRQHKEAPLLHYTAIEKYPPYSDDIRIALNACAVDQVYSDICVELYDRAHIGQKDIDIIFPGGILRVIIADVADIGQYIDEDEIFQAIYLDGFAPSKNPDMWSKDLCRWLADHSLQDGLTYCATFTAAGAVREALRDVGFDVKRVKGFGRKRHMTKAIL